MRVSFYSGLAIAALACEAIAVQLNMNNFDTAIEADFDKQLMAQIDNELDQRFNSRGGSSQMGGRGGQQMNN